MLCNGVAGASFQHRRGLRQGDSLSPYLFNIAIEPLVRMLELATEQGLMLGLPGAVHRTRVSLYADNVAVFVHPRQEDLRCLVAILEVFGRISCLCINPAKSSIFLIRCNGLDLTSITNCFRAPVDTFPTRYLGLPLSLTNPRKLLFQPLLEKIEHRLASYKTKLLSKGGRIVILKSVLSALSTFHLTVFEFPVWLRERIERYLRGWLWRGDLCCGGGSCLVRWTTICSPKEFGGLGVLDLDKFGRALRLRWEWLRWARPDKPWAAVSSPLNDYDLCLFAAVTTITVRDGRFTNFWNDAWLFRQRPKDIAPDLFRAARRKNRSVHDARWQFKWVADIAHGVNAANINQFLLLFSLVAEAPALSDGEDCIVWNLTATGCYSSHSAYLAQFQGIIRTSLGGLIWKVCPPEKCRFFGWLLAHNKIPIADLLTRRNIPNDKWCPFCYYVEETAVHLLVDCQFARSLWALIAGWI